MKHLARFFEPERSGHKTISGGRRGMIGPVTDERNDIKKEDPSFSFIIIKTPVLIMKSEIGKYVNNAAMTKSASLMPAAKHVVIPKAIHGLWLERDPIRQNVWHHVDAFLKEQHVLFDRKRNLLRPFFAKGPA